MLHVEHILFLSEFKETLIFLTDFRTILKYKFHKYPSSGSKVVPCGETELQTARHDEANSRFWQICEYT